MQAVNNFFVANSWTNFGGGTHLGAEARVSAKGYRSGLRTESSLAVGLLPGFQGKLLARSQ